MNKYSFYEAINQEITSTCAAWQRAHQVVLRSQGQRRERLLLQEHQLERHVQHVMGDYLACQRQQRIAKEER